MVSEFEGLTKTSLFTVHEQLGARLVDFAGWAMPLEYEGTVSEHEAVREDVGVFDVSHLGRVWVTGGGAEATVAATFTNDPARLDDGGSQYTLCCSDDGGILDDLIVYRVAEDRFLTIPNAANHRTVRSALEEAAAEHGAEIDEATARTSMLAVQGRRSLEVLTELYPTAASKVPYRGIGRIDAGPSGEGWFCRTGYTGEVGAEIILPGHDAPGVLRELVEQYDVTPVGLGARDTLRLEMGYPLHGQDLTRETDPFEAQLAWAVRLERDHFRGRDALLAKADRGPARRLWGVRAADRGIPRAEMEVQVAGRAVGEVTSGTYSPTLRTGIGLAYLEAGLGPDDEVEVDIRGNAVSFGVVRPPFVDADPKGGS
jgi:aminomethyltransferase